MVRRNYHWIKSIFLLLVFTVLSAQSFSLTYEYDETDLVRLVPEATDEDGDNVTFTFSAPLDENGEWQTTYDDSGVYDVVITADDGSSKTTEEITLRINNVNRPPQIVVEDIDVEETDFVDVQFDITDPDNDDVTVQFSSPLDENGRWDTTYDDEGIYEVSVRISDGEFEITRSFVLTVHNKNRAPVLDEFVPNEDDLTIDETESVDFFVDATDPDSDIISYTWFVDGEIAQEGKRFTYESDYDSSGEHQVTVEIVDSSGGAISEEWTVDVENVNRKPDISYLEDVVSREDELIILNLIEEDIDGETLSYTIDSPFNSDGEWSPTFEDSGEYTITVVASDGDLEDEKTIQVVVQDVDRAPDFLPVGDVAITEEDEFRLLLEATDPDLDDVRFSVTGLSEIQFDGNEIFWTPGYDYITVSQNFFARLLNRLRIDRFFYNFEKVVPLTLSACGKDLCTSQEMNVFVEHVNRAPLLDPLEDIVVLEGDTVTLLPQASDPDGDVLKFYFSDPLTTSGEWQTTFNDAGEYDVTVEVSDGKEYVGVPVKITVEEKNRAPSFGSLTDRAIKEGETLSFRVPVSDPDENELALTIEQLPRNAEFVDGVFTWTPDFDTVTPVDGSKKEFLLTFTLSDGETTIREETIGNDTSLVEEDVTIKKSIIVTVENVNRAPVINLLNPEEQFVNVFINTPQVFRVDAVDPDGDQLTYTWKFGFMNSVTGHDAIKKRFTSFGKKEVEVVVSDGDKETNYRWFITVGRRAKR